MRVQHVHTHIGNTEKKAAGPPTSSREKKTYDRGCGGAYRYAYTCKHAYMYTCMLYRYRYGYIDLDIDIDIYMHASIDIDAHRRIDIDIDRRIDINRRIDIDIYNMYMYIIYASATHTYTDREVDQKKKAAGPTYIGNPKKKAARACQKKTCHKTGRRRNLDRGSIRAYRQCKHGCLGHVAGN